MLCTLDVSIADLLQSTLHNATDSPFLRLPPDVRNRIYYFTFGNRTIHVRSIPDSNAMIYFGACRIDEECESVHVRSWSLFIPNSDCHWHSVYAKRHSDCTSRFTRSMLGPRWWLLLVCRQIYQEAALIPFTSNTYTFEGIACLKRFVQVLMPCQARALTRIVLVVGELDVLALPKPVPIPDRMLASLVGLKCLHLVLGAQWRVCWEQSWAKAYNNEFAKSFQFLNLHSFRKLHLAEFRIYAEIEIRDGMGPDPDAIRDRVGSWVKAEETNILTWAKR